MVSNIQMVDLRTQYQAIKTEVDQAIEEVLTDGCFIKGDAVKYFEEELAVYTKSKHVISCANGTDALQIALMALQLKPGDEVIIPAFTYVATGEAIALLNLIPVFVDVDPGTFNIDVSRIEALITSKTRAIIPVHLYGQCADMEGLMRLADEKGINVIEDAAQGIGSTYTFSDGTVKHAGTMGAIGTTSFFPSKNLGCYGDGGAIFTNDDELGKRIRMIANHGQARQYYHEIIGVNSRLDTIQAVVLRIKLKHLDDYAKARNKVAEKYDLAFADQTHFILPVRDPKSSHVFNQYTILVNGINRDELRQYLKEKGIPSMVYYPLPLHKQAAYRTYSADDHVLQVSLKLCETVLSLPIHTEMQEDVQQFIIKNMLSYKLNGDYMRTISG